MGQLVPELYQSFLLFPRKHDIGQFPGDVQLVAEFRVEDFVVDENSALGRMRQGAGRSGGRRAGAAWFGDVCKTFVFRTPGAVTPASLKPATIVSIYLVWKS